MKKQLLKYLLYNKVLVLLFALIFLSCEKNVSSRIDEAEVIIYFYNNSSDSIFFRKYDKNNSVFSETIINSEDSVLIGYSVYESYIEPNELLSRRTDSIVI